MTGKLPVVHVAISRGFLKFVRAKVAAADLAAEPARGETAGNCVSAEGIHEGYIVVQVCVCVCYKYLFIYINI